MNYSYIGNIKINKLKNIYTNKKYYFKQVLQIIKIKADNYGICYGYVSKLLNFSLITKN